jgi:hypothetical protein
MEWRYFSYNLQNFTVAKLSRIYYGQTAMLNSVARPFWQPKNFLKLIPPHPFQIAIFTDPAILP